MHADTSRISLKYIYCLVSLYFSRQRTRIRKYISCICLLFTAAHCLMLNRTHYIHHNVLVVALGRFNLHQFREQGTVNREVGSYNIHPDYSYALTGDSDIAVMTLRNTVDFSIFIRPICLWSGPPNIQNVINRMGYVVGWGQDERGNPWTEDPRMAMMPIVSLVRTYLSRFFFLNFAIRFTYKLNSNGKRSSLKTKRPKRLDISVTTKRLHYISRNV